MSSHRALLFTFQIIWAASRDQNIKCTTIGSFTNSKSRRANLITWYDWWTAFHSTGFPSERPFARWWKPSLDPKPDVLDEWPQSLFHLALVRIRNLKIYWRCLRLRHGAPSRGQRGGRLTIVEKVSWEAAIECFVETFQRPFLGYQSWATTPLFCLGVRGVRK